MLLYSECTKDVGGSVNNNYVCLRSMWERVDECTRCMYWDERKERRNRYFRMIWVTSPRLLATTKLFPGVCLTTFAPIQTSSSSGSHTPAPWKDHITMEMEKDGEIVLIGFSECSAPTSQDIQRRSVSNRRCRVDQQAVPTHRRI